MIIIFARISRMKFLSALFFRAFEHLDVAYYTNRKKKTLVSCGNAVRRNIKIIVKHAPRQSSVMRHPFHRRSKKRNRFRFRFAPSARFPLLHLSGKGAGKNFPLFASVANSVSLFFSFTCVRGCYFSLCQGVFTRSGVTGLV